VIQKYELQFHSLDNLIEQINIFQERPAEFRTIYYK